MALLFAESVEPALLVHDSSQTIGTVHAQTTLSRACEAFAVPRPAGLRVAAFADRKNVALLPTGYESDDRS